VAWSSQREVLDAIAIDVIDDGERRPETVMEERSVDTEELRPGLAGERDHRAGPTRDRRASRRARKDLRDPVPVEVG
jgi:hypothetical protein